MKTLKLTAAQKLDISDGLNISLDEVDDLSPRGKVDAWLRYNGIIGYTGQILEIVQNAFEINLGE